MRPYRFHLIALAILLLVATVSDSLFVVNEWDQVVVTEFRRPIRTLTDAGLYFKKPFVQEVHRFDKRLLRWDGKAHETFSKDRKTIEIDVTARWRISDPLQFLQRVPGGVREAHRRLDGIIESAVKNTLAKYDLYEIVRSTNRLHAQQKVRRGASDARSFALALAAPASGSGAIVARRTQPELWTSLLEGDRVLALDGQPIESPAALYQHLGRLRGKEVRLLVLPAGADPEGGAPEERTIQVAEEYEVALAGGGGGQQALKDVDFLGSEVEALGEGLGRPRVMAEILADARRELGRKEVDLGIHVEDILVKTLIYTKDVEQQVYAQMNAELKRWSERFRSIGRAQAEERLGEMARELAAIRSSAVRESDRIRGEGDAEATRVYAEAYRQDVNFYAFLELLESYKHALGKKNHTLVIPANGPFFQLLTGGRVDHLVDSLRAGTQPAVAPGAPGGDQAPGAEKGPGHR